MWKEMFVLSGGEFLKEFGVIAILLCVQVVLALYPMFTGHLMSLGVDTRFFIIYGGFTTFILLLPFSISFERKKWPKKVNLKFVTQVLMISIAGVLFQALMLMGIKKSSPITATAMPNLAPGFIFLIACSFGLEKVKLTCLYSKAKIVGTLICIIGAVAMSFFNGHQASQASVILIPATIDYVKIIGFFSLVGAVFVLSCNVVLQAQAMIEFPAPMSLSAVTALIGAFVTEIIRMIQERRLDFGWPVLVNIRVLIGAALLGGIVGGACTSICAWAMKKKGPVFVSMFSPIATVFSVIISCFTIGDSITIGSLLGMLIMFAGFYLCLWAKKKEDHVPKEKATGTTKATDVEEPLLS